MKIVDNKKGWLQKILFHTQDGPIQIRNERVRVDCRKRDLQKNV